MGLLALSTVVSAQTLPMPKIPPEAPPAEDPAASTPATADSPETLGTATQVRPRPWDYGLGVGVGWDSNVQFLVPDGQSSSAISPRGDLAHVFWSPKGQLRLGAAGTWIGYLQDNVSSTYSVLGSLDGTYRSSPNTTLRASGSYDFGNSISSGVLAAQGVLLPLVHARTLAGAVGVTRKLGLRTSLRLDGRVYATHFDQADIDTLGLVDGESIRGTAALERRLGPRDTAGFEYSLESAVGRLPPDPVEGNQWYLTHYGSLQWTHLLSPHSGLLLEAGISYTPDAQQAGLGQAKSFYGGASYTRQLRGSSVTLFARREVIPAFGLGVSRVENRLGLTAKVPVRRVWTLYLMGTHVKPETPQGVEYDYATPDEAFISVRRRLGRLFEVSTDARYRRRGSTSTFPAIEGFQFGIFLSLRSPTGRS